MASPDQPTPSPDPGRDADIVRERDRIAAELHNEVIRQLFVIGLQLQSTQAMAGDPLVRRRVEKAIIDLDHVIETIRDAVSPQSSANQTSLRRPRKAPQRPVYHEGCTEPTGELTPQWNLSGHRTTICWSSREGAGPTSIQIIT